MTVIVSLIVKCTVAKFSVHIYSAVKMSREAAFRCLFQQAGSAPPFYTNVLSFY